MPQAKSELTDKEILDLSTKFTNERPTNSIYGLAAGVIAALFTLFHVVNAFQPGMFSLDMVRSVHLTCVICLAYLMFPYVRKKSSAKVPFYDLILSALGIYVGLYSLINYESLVGRAATGYLLMDYVVAGLGILLILEAVRRVMGPALAIICGIFVLFAKFGTYLPGPISHPDYPWKSILEHLWLTKEGVFGIPLTVSAMYVIVFIIFGAVFDKAGAGHFFTDFAIALTGRMTGGPAKASVISSALFGMISGSSVANVMVDGVFTIPLMKRAGFRPEFAGGIEAATSTGGQIMPPVMGAAAFVMAEFLGIPYASIALAAAIPAALYFGGVYIAIDFEARKFGIRGLTREEIPSIKRTMVGGWYYFLPIGLIIYFLASGYTPMLGVVYSVFAVIAIFIIRTFVLNWLVPPAERKSVWRVLWHIVATVFSAFQDGGKGAVPVGLACASAGVIVGVVTMTGLGFKIGNAAIAISGGYLFPILLMTMLTSLVLGMGIPTTANYIITATICAPAILTFMAGDAGMPVRDFITVHPEAALSAHMFAFYFGVAADLTPPVALAAYAGSAIARANPMKTGYCAFLIGLGTYVVPYLFVYSPILLLVGVGASPVSWLYLLGMIVLTVIAMLSLNAGTIGHFLGGCGNIARSFFILAGILMVTPLNFLRAAGMVLFALFLFLQWRKHHRAGQTHRT